MPYEVHEHHGDCPDERPWAVVKIGDGALMGCHSSRQEAMDQVTALYANEEEDSAERMGFEAVLIPEGERTMDGREFAIGALSWRTPPLPLMMLKQDWGEGHSGSVLVGRIERIWRDGSEIRAEGSFASTTEGREAAQLCADQMLRWISVDTEFEPSSFEIIEENCGELDDGDCRQTMRITEGRLMGATMVAFPAFPSAVIVPKGEMIPTASENGRPAVADGSNATTQAATITTTISAPSVTTVGDGTVFVSDAPWNGSSGRFTDEQWRRATAGCEGKSDAPKTDCFANETEIITLDGIVPIGEVAGTRQFVLTAPEPSGGPTIPATRSGRWVESEIHTFAERPLLSVRLSRFGMEKTVRATHGHVWFATPDGRSRKRLNLDALRTDQLRPGMVLASLLPQPQTTRSAPSPFGIAAGIVFGDGHRRPGNGGSAVTLYGDKDAALLRYFEGCLMTPDKIDGEIRGMAVRGLPGSFKDRPQLSEGTSFLFGWLAGYVAADGHVDATGQVSLASASRSDLEFARLVALRLGIACGPVKMQVRSGFGRPEVALYSLRFIRSTVPFELLLIPEHRRRFDAVGDAKQAQVRWKVESVEDVGDMEETYCAVVPETETFALADYIWVHNCYLPHHEPGGAVSRAGVHAAAARFNQTQRAGKDRARGHLAGHYRNDLKEEVPDVLTASAVVAHALAFPAEPPAEWFSDPELVEPMPITITSEGRVYGHAALWNSCHIGRQGVCTTPPRSKANYAYFRTGAVRCPTGCEISTGTITIDTGHADLALDAYAAAAHYDHTGASVADVAVGEDEHGIWFSGALRPSVTDEQLRILRASALSGDWRPIGGQLELVGLLAVNVPGFPVPRSLAASARAYVHEGQQTALIAAAGPTPEHPLLRRVRELEMRLANLETVSRLLRPIAAQKLLKTLD